MGRGESPFEVSAPLWPPASSKKNTIACDMTTSISLSDLHGALPSTDHAAPRLAITCSISHRDGKTLFDFDGAGQAVHFKVPASLDEAQCGQVVQLFLQHTAPGHGTVIYGMTD